jgi:hypothetical protein
MEKHDAEVEPWLTKIVPSTYWTSPLVSWHGPGKMVVKGLKQFL